MYNFIDVNETSEGAVLPSEALKLNGQYIEDQIPGYRTLNVQGREALSPDVYSYETGLRDGTRLKSKRYPERIIIVQYQLSATTNEEFREAYNQLGRILDVENAELIFNDEQDKFFIGTPCIIGSVEPGRNSVVGEIEILCTDPFKYSVVEYEAEMNEAAASILIDYNGTYKSFPTLEADFYSEAEVADDGETAAALTGAGDCGFVAFFNESEKVVQLGDPDEVDGESGAFAKSQTLMNQLFQSSLAWGTTAKKLWAVNAGHALPTPVTQTGTVAMAAASYENAANDKSTSGALLKKKKSNIGSPYCYYTVAAKASSRTANSVFVSVAVTSALWQSGSYFGKGYGLTGSLYIGGKWHNAVLKNTTEYWRGTTGHTVNFSFIVDGLTGNQTVLTGIKFKVTRSDSLGDGSCTLSETVCANLAIPAYGVATAATHYLAPYSFGSGTGWHGPSITRDIGADAAGEVGAANFDFTYKHQMSIGTGETDASQMGAFQVQIMDASGANIAGVRIHKNKVGNKASLIFYVNGVKVHGEMVDLSYRNKAFGVGSTMNSAITKIGSKVTFAIGGVKKTFTDSAIESAKAAKVTFAFEQYSTSAVLSHNGLFWAKFVKHNCSTMKDIPNKFSANDVVTADCRSGEILLNGIPSPALGALGNDWEQFFLTPGLNQIGVAFSDWVDAAYAPTFKVRYREVFL